MGFRNARIRDIQRHTTIASEITTVTSPGKTINALGTGEYREVPLIAPFGIRWNPPGGCNVQLIKNWNSAEAAVALGTIVDEAVEPGEIQLFSKGGASLHLKNDGTILINNRLLIKQDGTLEVL